MAFRLPCSDFRTPGWNIHTRQYVVYVESVVVVVVAAAKGCIPDALRGRRFLYRRQSIVNNDVHEEAYRFR